MLYEFLKRKLHYCLNGPGAGSLREEKTPEPGNTDDSALRSTLQDTLKNLRSALGESCDLKIHPFRLGRDGRIQGALAYIDGLADNALVTESILRPLTGWKDESEAFQQGSDLAETLAQEVLCAGDITAVRSLEELASGCLSGDTAILLEGCGTGLVVSTKGWDKRSVAEPQSETVVRGPREGFTENLRTNTALIRRRIQGGKLSVERLTVGRKTRTNICLMFLDGVADGKVVDEVRRRISALDVDSILDSGYIEQYIEDAPFSPFSTVGYSEKPDVVAAKVLEGRVAIVVDGTPFVLTAPMLFVESFQTTEDYYTRPLYASLIRLLRYFGYIITVFAPALYIALTSFHQELIPTTLLFTIANAREGTPFPVFVETALMVFAFEVLREAGIRLPRPVGQAISIVGALIMGDAAIAAGLVGAPVVITVAITAVASFVVPAQNDSSSILRVLMMIAGSVFGGYGIAMGFLAVLLHLGTLQSFGVTYFDGFARTRSLQDSVVRMPLWTMTTRPKGIARGDTTRRRFFIPPARPYARRDQTEEEGGK